MSFPARSLACIVSVVALPDVTVALSTVTREVLTEIAPGVTVMVGSVVLMGLPPIVAPMLLAVPAVTPVNVAVYVP